MIMMKKGTRSSNRSKPKSRSLTVTTIRHEQAILSVEWYFIVEKLTLAERPMCVFYKAITLWLTGKSKKSLKHAR